MGIEIGSVDVAPLSIVFYIGPAAGGAQHMDYTAVDDTAHIIIRAAVARAEQAILSGNIDLVITVGEGAAARQTAGTAGNKVAIT